MPQPSLNVEAVTGEDKPAPEAFDEFLAIISHELRVPMMAILGWAEILGSRQIDPETLAMAAGVIKRNARFQADLVRELLDYSTVASEKHSLSLRTVSLQAIIESTIESLIPISSEKLIEMEMHSDSPNSEMDGDPVRLQQVFSNLLFNAIKFTPSRGAVTVLLQTGSKYHKVVVSDTGEGISAEFLPLVFDPYQQASQKKTSARGGLGLGLMIARRIVERHHGSIKAESPGVNKGSVFTVQLPRRQPAQLFVHAVT